MTELSIVASASLPTRFGDFRVVTFAPEPGLVSGSEDEKEHLALVRGDVRGQAAVLTRMHSECLTGDALASLRCDCRDQLEAAMAEIGRQPCGVLLYLRQEGRGIGLANKIRAYALQDDGLDTVEANLALGFRDDERDYAYAADMLRALGVVSLRLMTNNPSKIRQLEEYGIEVSERVAHVLPPNGHNRRYLETKARRSGHLITVPVAETPTQPPQSSVPRKTKVATVK